MSKQRKNDSKNPDHLLADENSHALNQRFYDAPPYDYFEQRLMSLMLVVRKSEEPDRLLAEGIRIGNMSIQGESPDITLSDERRK